MKKSLVLTSILTALCLTSACSKDDDSKNKPAQNPAASSSSNEKSGGTMVEGQNYYPAQDSDKIACMESIAIQFGRSFVLPNSTTGSVLINGGLGAKDRFYAQNGIIMQAADDQEYSAIPNDQKKLAADQSAVLALDLAKPYAEIANAPKQEKAPESLGVKGNAWITLNGFNASVLDAFEMRDMKAEGAFQIVVRFPESKKDVNEVMQFSVKELKEILGSEVTVLKRDGKDNSTCSASKN